MVLILEDDFAKIEKWASVILKHTLPDRVQVLYRLTLKISLLISFWFFIMISLNLFKCNAFTNMIVLVFYQYKPHQMQNNCFKPEIPILQSIHWPLFYKINDNLCSFVILIRYFVVFNLICVFFNKVCSQNDKCWIGHQ